MNRNLFSSFVLAVITISLYAQDPNILWQRTIGGENQDIEYFIISTTDGGFLTGGTSKSMISGEKTEDSFGEEDFWILKFNAEGEIEWQRTLGGDQADTAFNARQTYDGGFLIVGGSYSGISGNKTEPSRGDRDYWIIKLDADGNTLWQKTYGGDSNDLGKDIEILDNGHYLVLGYSYSGISGDRTIPNNSNGDCWLLVINDNGELISQRSHPIYGAESASHIRNTSNGGYAISASSNMEDYILSNYNENGNFLWEKNFGGDGWDFATNFIVTADNGFIIIGFSDSNISGNKTEDSRGATDYWILKLNSMGEIQWQKTFGGNEIDAPYTIIETPDYGYLLVGYSASEISGDKTVGLVEPTDYWFLKLNSVGIIEWQKDIGGDGADARPRATLINDGSLVISGISNSNISGDKTENSRGESDFWIVKYNIILDIVENPLLSATTLYPNPAKNTLQLNTQDKTIDQINIYTMTGSKVLQLDVDTVSPTVDVSSLASGVYYVQLYSGKNVALKKFVKE
ncbi:MAG: T9SS type A sorting domain-containing protein [Aequorivita sp.]|nr:T9SS type A sorting domain-containing protein [Aequorivita sp.]